jgi:lysophospholipase L1-like esterase
MKISRILVPALLTMLSACATHQPGQKSTEKGWYSAWAMAHNARAVTPHAPAMSGRSVRMILIPSISGTGVRVKIENTMGEAPVVFSAASIGVAGNGATVRENTMTRLTFGGQSGLTLAPGAGAYSDPVPFKVTAFEKLSLSLDVQSAADVSTHHVGLRINWSAAGARAAEASAAGFEPLPEIPPLNSGQWPYYWVAALDVQSNEATGSIVLFADSITDGRCSTRDAKGIVQPNLDLRWGDIMAARLAERPKSEHKAIAISSISGNRVLGRGNGPSAFERLERDVLDRAGVTHVVFFMGSNDVAANFTAAQVIAGTQQIIALIRSRGIKIIGVTVIPRGRPAPETGWTAATEKQRLVLNDWIRTKANFDGVIDFDALMKDSPVVKQADGSMAPAMPAAWNCDGTHPSTAGYKAMGEFVDLNLFR